MKFKLSILLAILVLSLSCSRKETTKVFQESDKPAELLRYGNSFFQQGDIENAFIAYGIIYNSYPTSPEYIDAAIGLSKTYGEFKDYDKEFEILLNLLRENVIPSKVPKIYNAIAEFYEKSAGISEELTGESSGDFRTAIQYYQKAIDYPNSKDAFEKGYAQFKIGVLYEEMRDYQKAIAAFQNTINNFGDTEWAKKAEAEIEKIRTKLNQITQIRETTPGEVPADTTTAQPPDTTATDTTRQVSTPPDF